MIYVNLDLTWLDFDLKDPVGPIGIPCGNGYKSMVIPYEINWITKQIETNDENVTHMTLMTSKVLLTVLRMAR